MLALNSLRTTKSKTGKAEPFGAAGVGLAPSPWRRTRLALGQTHPEAFPRVEFSPARAERTVAAVEDRSMKASNAID
jgi:hypothetical protein